MIGELLGVMVAFKFFGDFLQSQSSIAFCDNMGALYAIVKGDSSCLDVAILSHELALKIASIDSQLWLEYVASQSNVADGGSRTGIDCRTSASLNILLRSVPCPILPQLVDGDRDFDRFWQPSRPPPKMMIGGWRMPLLLIGRLVCHRRSTVSGAPRSCSFSS